MYASYNCFTCFGSNLQVQDTSPDKPTHQISLSNVPPNLQNCTSPSLDVTQAPALLRSQPGTEPGPLTIRVIIKLGLFMVLGSKGPGP